MKTHVIFMKNGRKEIPLSPCKDQLAEDYIPITCQLHVLRGDKILILFDIYRITCFRGKNPIKYIYIYFYL